MFWNELIPRMRTVLREPGEPLASTVTPATRPSSRLSTLAEVSLSRLSVSTLDTAPVMSARRWVVYPVTMTSSSTATARSKMTSRVVRPAISSPSARYPMSVKINTPSAGAVKE